MVAAGILLSRILGLVRTRAFAHFFGTSDAGDAFMAAFKIPNFLQNLFGEGVLSASFIPGYARLRAMGREDEARHVAGAVFGLLGVVVSAIVAVGVLLAGPITDLIAPGFSGAKRDLTVLVVRVLFPGAGLLVMSAWCLGVLNSHRRFFLSYTAPVIWNVAMIATLIGFGPRRGADELAVVLAWGSVAGSLLQFVVQLPTALQVLGGLRPAVSITHAEVRSVLANFVPVFIGRGVVQVSAFVDTILASFLPTGAVTALGYAQIISYLPVSLFGMSVAAAELPEMSSATGETEQVHAVMRTRLDRGLGRIAFFVVPSAAAFLALGGVLAGALYQSGQFTRQDSRYVWVILAGSAVGLLAATMGRLYSSAYYALRDTRTPLRFALVRVTLTVALGYLFCLPLPRLLGLELRWGAVGLTASAGIAGWIEFALLRRQLNLRIGVTGVALGRVLRLWVAAGVAAAVAWGALVLAGDRHPIILALVSLLPYGAVYLALTNLFGMEEAAALIRRLPGARARSRP